jgi:hypothetical protein
VVIGDNAKLPDMMKLLHDRPILIAALALTILVEILLIVLVYVQIGPVRLPHQVIRTALQLFLMMPIVLSRSHLALLALAGFHIFSAMFGLSRTDLDGVRITMSIFHVVIAFTIYFHDVLEKWFIVRPQEEFDRKDQD